MRVPASYGGALLAFLLLTTVVRVTWRPLAWIGLVSYSLYLFHPVVLYRLQHLAVGWSDVALGVVLTTAFSILLAAVVYYGVERPCMALGRRLSTPRPQLQMKAAE